jgi:hypothetical protein
MAASGNSKSSIMTYAHTHQAKVDEKLKTFEYPSSLPPQRSAAVPQPTNNKDQ